MTKSIYDDEYRKMIGKLAAKRKELGIFQEDLAKKLSWPQPTISKIETFTRRLDLIETVRICEILGIDIADLIEKKPPKK